MRHRGSQKWGLLSSKGSYRTAAPFKPSKQLVLSASAILGSASSVAPLVASPLPLLQRKKIKRLKFKYKVHYSFSLNRLFLCQSRRILMHDGMPGDRTNGSDHTNSTPLCHIVQFQQCIFIRPIAICTDNYAARLAAMDPSDPFSRKIRHPAAIGRDGDHCNIIPGNSVRKSPSRFSA